jgi:thymidylate synthase ThyX
VIKAEILLDSIGADGSAPRLTTWKLTFPRFILAEVNTHRMFSRNYPSSRAIPVLKRMGMVIHAPVMPIEWGLDKPGMQSSAKATGIRLWLAKATWRAASLAAVAAAFCLVKLGIHKQVANRILEPFVEVTGLVTATQVGWENFFALRAEGSADPHVQALAYQMLALYNTNTPQVLQPGEWHVPFGSMMEPGLTWDERIKVAVARCARVSFNSFDGEDTPAKDAKLHDRLAASGHWSSFEHIAQVPESGARTLVTAPGCPPEELERLRKHIDEAKADPDYTIVCNYDVNWASLQPLMGGNLPGWVQLRKTYPNECRKDPRVQFGDTTKELNQLLLAATVNA